MNRTSSPRPRGRARSNPSTVPLPGIVGHSAAMQEVYLRTRRAARSNASVLLLGETGTGKEMIAQALHQHSGRSTGPLVKVNCGALSEALLESELFGHVRGSFTDAVKDRTGRFEAAHTGTLFLDEINSTSCKLQVKLLRVLQEREFERVGDTRTIRVDVRVIAASNCDLYKEISAGRFREDLYWRLNVIPITLPPLRRRVEDIRPLAEHFLTQLREQNGGNVQRIHPDAMRALENYRWPGNVRELFNYVERAMVFCDGDEITVDLLPEAVLSNQPSPDGMLRGADAGSLIQEFVYNSIADANGSSQLHSKIVDPVERELIAQVMRSSNYVQKKAAERLGINRNTLHKKLKQYGLENGEADS